MSRNVSLCIFFIFSFSLLSQGEDSYLINFKTLEKYDASNNNVILKSGVVLNINKVVHYEERYSTKEGSFSRRASVTNVRNFNTVHSTLISKYFDYIEKEKVFTGVHRVCHGMRTYIPDHFIWVGYAHKDFENQDKYNIYLDRINEEQTQSFRKKINKKVQDDKSFDEKYYTFKDRDYMEFSYNQDGVIPNQVEYTPSLLEGLLSIFNKELREEIDQKMNADITPFGESLITINGNDYTQSVVRMFGHGGPSWNSYETLGRKEIYALYFKNVGALFRIKYGLISEANLRCSRYKGFYESNTEYSGWVFKKNDNERKLSVIGLKI